jgi:competence protein ComEC
VDKRTKFILFIFLLITALIWIAILTFPNNNLKIIACDVGQGDALIIIQGQKQVLVDGGPNNKIIECLGRYMPFWDRHLDVVVMTHPEQDHMGGLLEVFTTYRVDFFLADLVDNPSNEGYQALKKEVGSLGTKVINPDSSTTLRLGEVVLDVVNPVHQENKQVLGAFTTTENLNNFSIVFNLHYGNFDALFTGDILPDITDEIIATNEITDIEYLKVPHHGSKNGLTKELLERSSPEVAVISVGRKNRYHHPSPDVVEMLKDIKVLRTDQGGDVVVETDGTSWWVVK